LEVITIRFSDRFKGNAIEIANPRSSDFRAAEANSPLLLINLFDGSGHEVLIT